MWLEGGVNIPSYKYKCKDCGKIWEFACPISLLEETKPKVCECGSDYIQIVFSKSGAIWKCGKDSI